MDKSINNDRSRRNAKLWLSMVGLKGGTLECFPELKPLENTQLSQQMVIDEEVMKKIKMSLTSNQLTLISICKGGGLSTLFQYMTEDSLQMSLDRLTITVAIDLDSPSINQKTSSSFIEEYIKRHTIMNLLNLTWEDRLKRTDYYDCINFNESKYVELSLYKATMMEKIISTDTYSFTNLCRDFPLVQKPFGEFCNYLLTNFRLQIHIFFHCPETVGEDSFLNFMGALKSIYDNNIINIAALREVYFCTPSTRVELDREYRRPYNTIIVPSYSPGQIYTMLEGRYQPSIPGLRGRKTVELSSVFSEKFIYYAWNEFLSLREIIEKVKELMARRFDCEEQNLTYLLEPEVPQKKNNQEKSTDSPPRKRFTRRKNNENQELRGRHGNPK